jgi:hypothetical protein
MSAAIWALGNRVEMGPFTTLLVSVPLGIVVYGAVLLALGEPQARNILDRISRRG